MTTVNRLLIESFKQLLREVHPEQGPNLTCEECTQVLDAFAELVVRGIDVPELMPLVQEHLNRCDQCNLAFDQLLETLQP